MTAEVECFGLATLGVPPVKIAQATKSGQLLLLNGFGSFQNASYDIHPLDNSERETQIKSVFDTLDRLLNPQDSPRYHMLASEQRFTSPTTVPVYHRSRQAAWAPIPPSTSVLQDRLLADRQAVSLDGIAMNHDDVEYMRVHGVDIPSTSGFVPVARAGALYCVAGFMAAHGEGDLGGIAPEVRIPEGHQWKGDRIRREVGYIWEHKLQPIMQELQLDSRHISKASVFYTEPDEIGEIIASWKALFDGRPPLTSYISVRKNGLAITDAKIEVNLLLDAQRIQNNNTPSFTVLPDGYSAVTRFGDHLLFVLYPDAMESQHDPDVHHAEYETYSIAEKLQQALKENNASFSQVARIAQTYTHRPDVLPSCRIWEKYFGERPIPLSASFTNRLPLNSIHSCVEAWVYKPQET